MPDEVCDWLDANAPDVDYVAIDGKAVLVRLVRDHLLPVLDQHVEVVEIVTSHNPIRATLVDGVGVEGCWHGDQAAPDLTPHVVEVPMVDVLAAIMKEGRIMSDSDFSLALAWVKAGAKIARAGWNSTNMYVVHQAGYPDGVAINGNTAKATGLPEGTVCSFRPYLTMHAADGSFVPWVATQSDLLADDWYAVKP